MSGEAIGWVFRYSPMRGVAFRVHLALGDSANDAHANEIWASVGYIAKKARTDRKSAGEALGELCEAGLIGLLEERPGGTNRYQLAFPDGLAEVVPRVRAQASPGAGTGLNRVRAGASGGAGRALTNPIETNGEPNVRVAPKPDSLSSGRFAEIATEYEWAQNFIEWEYSKFVEHSEAHGRKFVNVDAGFRHWLSNAHPPEARAS